MIPEWGWLIIAALTVAFFIVSQRWIGPENGLMAQRPTTRSVKLYCVRVLFYLPLCFAAVLMHVPFIKVFVIIGLSTFGQAFGEAFTEEGT